MRSQTRTGGRDFYTVTAGIFFITLLPILLTVCSGRTGDTGQSAPTAPDSEAAAEVVSARRRILYVDSYHAEYEASIMRQGAAREILEAADIEMRVVYLDA